MEHLQIKGVVESITYRNKENSYTVIKLKTNNEEIVATGYMPFISENDSVILHGNYVFHSTYGQQFKCELCEVAVPQTQSQILKFLSSGAIKGVGPATAMRIVELFKSDTLDIIENHPTELTRVKGISIDKAVSISEQYKMQFGIRDIMIELSKYNITPTEATDIFRCLGSKSIEIIKQNPYTLCNYTIGFSFERVDEIAVDLGIETENIYRIAAGIEFVLKTNLNNGHTCLPENKLLNVSSKFLEIDLSLVQEALYVMIDSFRLYSQTFDNTSYIYLPEYAVAEEFIARRVESILNNNKQLNDITEQELKLVENKLNIIFDDMQISAVNCAMRNSLFILTGGPGTGKTTTLNAIIKIFENRKLKIELAAPTGRAAKRMTELTGKPSATIHRLLESEWDEKNAKQFFSRNQKNQLDCDVLIIDEMSMVDVQLFKALLEASKLTTRIILVGDSDQLPSVGAGNVLNDLIFSNRVPFVKLDKIFRQAAKSAIITNSHKIITGYVPDIEEKTSDFFFIRKDSEYSVSKTVIDLCCERLPKAYGYSTTADIQVLCPSKKRICGTQNLNKLLQDKINPGTESTDEIFFKSSCFRVGDKVMNIKNDYDIPWTSDSGEVGTGIYNGDIGFICDIDARNRLIKVEYDNKIASYYEEQISLLEHAYAITIHKSQGSEFDCVIIPLFNTSPLLKYRNLLYTAITRAKKLVILVGDSNIFEDMISNDKKTLRYTTLLKLLTESEI